MKRTALLLAALLTAAASNGTAQESADRSRIAPAERYRHLDRGKLERNYIEGLRSDNNGVVESAIAQVIKMKMVMPEEEFTGLKAEFGRLSVGGRTAQMRYKAYLAGLVLDNVSIFTRECGREYETPEALFSAISNRLQSELLGRNVKYVFQQ